MGGPWLRHLCRGLAAEDRPEIGCPAFQSLADSYSGRGCLLGSDFEGRATSRRRLLWRSISSCSTLKARQSFGLCMWLAEERQRVECVRWSCFHVPRPPSSLCAEHLCYPRSRFASKCGSICRTSQDVRRHLLGKRAHSQTRRSCKKSTLIREVVK